MKNIAFIGLIFFCLVGISANANKMVVEGTYQGKNLYVQNPFTSTGVGFCTVEVLINGQRTTDEWNSSAFEIDFQNFNIQLGTKVVVEIRHKDDCTPRVINLDDIKPRSTFQTIEIKVSKDGLLNWSTKNEIGKLNYIIEQKRWNKWVKVGDVEGGGNQQFNSYSFKIPQHSGTNTFRVKQVDASGEPRYSPETGFRSVKPEITPKIDKKSISFSDETMYEIFDRYGNIKKKGTGTSIDISQLEKGTYYLNYDNKMETFSK